jgi:hypothetical protein
MLLFIPSMFWRKNRNALFYLLWMDVIESDTSLFWDVNERLFGKEIISYRYTFQKCFSDVNLKRRLEADRNRR